MVDKQKAKNTHFRQTAKAFRAERQTQAFSKINRNLPYRVYNFSKSVFKYNFQKLQNMVTKENIAKNLRLEKLKKRS